MNRLKYIARGVFLVLTVLLLINLSNATDDKAETVAEFKLKMLEKMRNDSLGAGNQIDMLLDETTKYMDNAAQVKKRVRNLTGLLGLFVVAEVGFLIFGNRNLVRQEDKKVR